MIVNFPNANSEQAEPTSDVELDDAWGANSLPTGAGPRLYRPPNQYRAFLNNPVSLVDPMGLFASQGHRTATQNGLQQGGVPQPAIDVISDADVAQDNGWWNDTGPFHIAANHGDNGRAGIAAALELMNERWHNIQNLGGEGTCLTCEELRTALEEFGKILHAIQDLYSHSNYIELMNDQMGDSADVNGENQIPLWGMPPGSTDIPKGVYTGNYVFHGPFRAIPSPAPTHDQMSKDSPTTPAGSVKNRNGVSMYDLAVDAASRATTAAWHQLEEIIPDLMSRIKHCEQNGTFAKGELLK